MLVLDRLIGLASPEAALRRAVRLSDEGKAAQAFPLLTRSAKAGIADAEYRVACCYLEGTGVPASRIEGARWLQRAAGRGHVEAQTLLGGLCVHGLAGDMSGDRPNAYLPKRGRANRISPPPSNGRGRRPKPAQPRPRRCSPMC
jgi:hypothetical protein